MSNAASHRAPGYRFSHFDQTKDVAVYVDDATVAYWTEAPIAPVEFCADVEMSDELVSFDLYAVPVQS